MDVGVGRFFFTWKKLLFGWFELVEIHAFVFKREPVETQVNSCGIFIHFSISTAVEFCPSIVAHEGSETLKTEGREIYVGSFLSERFKGKVVFVGKVCSSFDIGLKGIRARHFV